MSYVRRSVYFKEDELELLEFVESEAGNFNVAIKNIVKQVAENGNESNNILEILVMLRQLGGNVAEIKAELSHLKHFPMQIAPLSKPIEEINVDLVANKQEDQRDYSGFDDL